jgi:uncharacterized repeat protein (TIGR03837 family)
MGELCRAHLRGPGVQPRRAPVRFDNRAMLWDVFCRVVDNFGDAGVCWRLAANLASRGESVRLWIDDPTALDWMAPQGAAGVSVLPWRDPLPDERPGDVVVEAFGCTPPASFVERMAQAAKPPVWINFEYLSAEDYVRRSHGLRSPQMAGPGRGLDKWFFYPGFTDGTGGLLREPDLAAQRLAFDAGEWKSRVLGLPADGERAQVTLFCYENAGIAALLAQCARARVRLLVTPGLAARQVAAQLACSSEPGTRIEHGGAQVVMLPWLGQADFDRLLWSGDLNFVRGEDSLARALLAGHPFVWQLYPQHDGAHVPKLDAFVDWFARDAAPGLREELHTRFTRWNLLDARAPQFDLPPSTHWRALCARRHAELLAQDDLTARLLGFAGEKS